MDERRIPPSSIEAEMSVLGAAFLDNNCLKKVSGMIDATDFFIERHRHVFHAMLSLRLKGEPIDLVTMSTKLKEQGTLEECGGGAYLTNLFEYTPTSANVHYYCQIVKEMSDRRKLITCALSLMGRAYQDNLEDILPDAKSEIQEIAAGLDSMSGVSASDIVPFEKRMERYHEYIKRVERCRFETGFDLIDSDIRGVAPGEVLTLIAYSGTFKTAWLQNILIGGAERTGKYSLFFSLEMPVEKVAEREIQMKAKMSGYAVERAVKYDLNAVKDAMFLSGCGSAALLVCDKPRLTVEKLGRYIEMAQNKYGEIGAVGIDYLGLMQAPGKTLFERTAFNSIEIKNLAKEYRVPIILLSQVNRGYAASKNMEIETDAAKGGGDVEAGADFMLGFYQDKAKNLICKLLKNRNGPTGKQYLVDIDRSTLRFNGVSEYNPKEEKKGGIDY